MPSNTYEEPQRAARRAAIERVMARYPNISEDELYGLLNYFRRDASAYDRATIASNGEIVEQYRQFSKDHSLDRLGVIETLACVLFVLLLIAGILFFTVGDWEL